jgi:hypothetical protein
MDETQDLSDRTTQPELTKPPKHKPRSRVQQGLLRFLRRLLLPLTPLVVWYIGNICAGIFYLSDLSQLGNSTQLTRLLLPGVLASEPIPLWGDILIAILMLGLFLGCLRGVWVEARETLSEVQNNSQGRPEGSSSQRPPSGNPVDRYLWLLILVIATIITLLVRPAQSNLDGLLIDIAITIAAVLLMLAVTGQADLQSGYSIVP